MPPPRIRPQILTLLSRIKPNPKLDCPSRQFSRTILLRSSILPPFLRAWGRPIKFTAKLFITLHLFITYVGTVVPTSGISMMPTIPHSYNGNPWILESRLHRRGRDIAVGDVVTYTSPAKPFAGTGCKRVVGMPGDFVSVVTQGRGTEDMDKHEHEGDWANVKGEVVQVPEGHCWLAGDNLEWSRDSRLFGPVPLNLVKGKVMAVVWPPSAWKTLGGEEGLRDAQQKEHEPVVSS